MITLRTRGLKEFQDYINFLARNMRGVATEKITDYLIGDGRRGLKRYYPYRYVSRKSAYGRTFVNKRQQGLVMARIREGTIDPGAPHRTGQMQRGWHREGQGATSRAVNDVPHAYHVMDTKGQARQPKKVGWRNVADIVSTNIKGAVRAAEQAIAKLRK